MLLTVLLALFGCKGRAPQGPDDSPPQDSPTQEPTAEDCGSGRDEDLDGLTDCEDADCFDDPGCWELICDDGLDNDDDGLADCEDPDCVGACAESAELWITGGGFDLRWRSSWVWSSNSTYSGGMVSYFHSTWGIDGPPSGRDIQGSVRVHGPAGSELCAWSAGDWRASGWGGGGGWGVLLPPRSSTAFEPGCRLGTDFQLPLPEKLELAFGSPDAWTPSGLHWYRGIASSSRSTVSTAQGGFKKDLQYKLELSSGSVMQWDPRER